MFNMKVLLLACVVTLASANLMQGYHGPIGIPTAERMKQEETSRIVGGLAVPIGVHPYFAGLLVTLTTGQTSVCGGTLLSARRVLTAATCWFDGFFQGRAITVVLGTNRIYGTTGTRLTASGVFVHQEYNALKHVNDIAILVIPGVTLNNNVAAVRLPPAGSSNYASAFAHAIGYGKTGDWSAISTDQAQSAVALPVITNEVCKKSYPTIVTDGILCTSGNNGWGVCGGDAGGPLVVTSDVNGTQALIGVILGPGPSGCQSGQPSLYTRVTSHLSWIQSFL